MESKYITDRVLSEIMIFLRTLDTIYVGNELKTKRFLRAVYWFLESGIKWRFLPKEFGKWSSVFKRFNEWSNKGIWEALHAYCIKHPDLQCVMIDSTIIRAHPAAGGYKKGSNRQEGLGRCAGGFTSKVHLLVEGLGMLLSFKVTPGNESDITHAPALVSPITGIPVVADMGYDSDPFRELLLRQGCTPVIPYRKNRIIIPEYNREIYRERFLVESCISKMKQFRHIFQRFDKSKRNYCSFISLFGALQWLS